MAHLVPDGSQIGGGGVFTFNLITETFGFACCYTHRRFHRKKRDTPCLIVSAVMILPMGKVIDGEALKLSAKRGH